MTPEATRQGPGAGRQGLRLQVAMTALTLTLVGALVLWQARPSGEEPTAPAASSAAHSSAAEGAVPLGGPAEQRREEQRTQAAAETARVTTRGSLAEPFGELATRAPAMVPTVYIVESAERAQGLRAGIEQTNAFRATHGEPPLRAEVVWFDSAEAEAGFRQALNWMRAVPGQWSISVTDLRARAALGTVAGSYGDGIVRQLDAPTAERLGVPVAP